MSVVAVLILTSARPVSTDQNVPAHAATSPADAGTPWTGATSAATQGEGDGRLQTAKGVVGPAVGGSLSGPNHPDETDYCEVWPDLVKLIAPDFLLGHFQTLIKQFPIIFIWL